MLSGKAGRDGNTFSRRLVADSIRASCRLGGLCPHTATKGQTLNTLQTPEGDVDHGTRSRYLQTSAVGTQGMARGPFPKILSTLHQQRQILAYLKHDMQPKQLTYGHLAPLRPSSDAIRSERSPMLQLRHSIDSVALALRDIFEVHKGPYCDFASSRVIRYAMPVDDRVSQSHHAQMPSQINSYSPTGKNGHFSVDYRVVASCRKAH